MTRLLGNRFQTKVGKSTFYIILQLFCCGILATLETRRLTTAPSLFLPILGLLLLLLYRESIILCTVVN